MRQLTTLACALLCWGITSAQQVNTQIGRVTTAFDYTDSKGGTIENLISGNGFSYAAGYRFPLGERIFMNMDLIHNVYSSFGSDGIYGNSFSWKTEYMGLSAGVEGEVWKNRGYTLLLRADVDPQFMLKGVQTINDQVYNLKGVEQFDTPYLFYRGGAGFSFCAETNLAIVLKYMYGVGVPFRKSEDGESLKFNTHTLSIGVQWSFRKCDYCYSKRYR